jgi:magnesium chelatase family protein
MVVAAANPCPCGYRDHPTRSCRCSDLAQQRYLDRLSGPLLDRIDLQVAVPPVQVGQLSSRARGESSASVRERVVAARDRQSRRRQLGETAAAVNAHLGPREIDTVAMPDREGRKMLELAVRRLGLSARGYLKVLRVARTIADLEMSDRVRSVHVAEALQARLFDRELARTA